VKGAERQIAVAIHDIEPATFERCALIRDWLDDHGVDRVTLLVVPAPGLHPFFQRRPDLAAWLHDCRERGDAIAQHGLQHRLTAASGRLRRGGRDAEFARADAAAARAGVATGRRLLGLAGIAPRGFVAPAYVYTRALERELAGSFDWWATLLRIVRRDDAELVPALSLRHSALGIRAGALTSRRLLRLDLHPADFDRPSRVFALESVLTSSRRTPVTYDDLCRRP
jgi:predicted deacetylase